MPGTHQAAALTTIGQSLSIIQRSTPPPKEGEVLIQVKAVAVNPVDYIQREYGMPPVPILPTVCGSDVAGIVVDANNTSGLTVGTRVLAFASSFYQNGSPDHGAFQEVVLARREGVVPLPDGMSFEEGCIMPLAVLTALSGYTTIDIPITTPLTRGKEGKKSAILIWGASSSVGTFAVQTAKSLGFVVYATAGAANVQYIESLGAEITFDYKDPAVVEKIIQQAETDGVDLRTAHVVIGSGLQPTVDILAVTKGAGEAKIAHAPLLPDDAPKKDGIEVKFTFPPTDEMERNKHISDCFQGWLKKGLEDGIVIPSPKIQIVKGGLAGLNEALDLLKAGVSATKVVVTL